MNGTARVALVSVAVTLLAASPPSAQEATSDAEVPRAGTLPGIESPAFPYARPEEVGLSSERLNRLGDEIAEWVTNGDLVGGELLIVKAGKAVWHEAYGWSDRERRIPVERNSIWSIKSMSKPFTATAVLMLADEGKLSLDDPVNRYIPGFAGDPRTTIGHLLSHTSGYRDEDLGDPAFYHGSLAEWVEDWASRAPSGTFGEYEYTDFGFAAAGSIVESVAGVPIGEFTEERIVRPLGLEDTRTFFSDDPAWRARLNPWYRWSDEAGQYELRWTVDFRGWSFYPAAWGMFSTAMDYAGFMALWMNEGAWEGVRLLEEETVEEALEPHAYLGDTGVYGYGWFLNHPRGAMGTPSVFYHGGGDGTRAVVFPDDDTMVVFLTHSRGGGHLDALMNRLGVLEIFDHVGPFLVPSNAREVAETVLPLERRAAYVGSFAVEDGSGGVPPGAPRVWEEDGRLHVRLGRAGAKADFRFHLVPLGDDRFALGRYRDGALRGVDPLYGVRFILEDGVASALELLEGDRVVFTAPRIDPDSLAARIESERSRVSVADLVYEALESGGIQAARARHRALRDSRPDSVHFGEGHLNTLGYRLLTESRILEAIAVFEMNVEAYPEEPNPYDSLGDAYRAAGRLEEARRSYERAVELAEEKGHENLEMYRGKLEGVTGRLEEPYQRPPQLDDGWRTGTSEEVGRSHGPLEEMTQALRRDEYPNVHAVLIAKDRRLVYEEHFEGTAWLWRDGRREAVSTTFDRATLHEVRSVTKSVTSAVFGIALESGAMRSVDQPLFDHFPDYAHLATPEKRRISLRHVLTMSGGLEWTEVLEDWDDEQVLYADPDPAAFVLSRPLEVEPGTRWEYNGGLTALLGLVIARATGEAFGEYARARLFEPLGITDVEWGWQGTAENPRPGEDGSVYVSSCCRTAWEHIEEFRWDGTHPWSSVASPPAGLWIRPRDLLKFGSLYLDGGRWNGRQVVPERWVEESLAHHIDRSDPPSEDHGHAAVSHRGYGYQWYHDRYELPYGDLTVHAAYGNGGQQVWVVPALNLVAVQVTGNYDRWYAGYQAERLLLERIVPWALGVEATYRHEIARPAHTLEPGEWSSTALTPQERAMYVGSYDFAGESLRVYEENGGLRFELPGPGAVDLLPVGDHVFAAGYVEAGEPRRIYWPDARLHFVRDEAGNVEGFEWRDIATGERTSAGQRAE